LRLYQEKKRVERYRAMVKEDIILWGKFKEDVKDRLTKEQYKLLCRLHAQLFNHKYYEPCNCAPQKLVGWIKDIDKIYGEYI